MPAHNLTAEQQVVEIHDEFIVESAEYILADSERRREIITHVNALLDAYLDLWPFLMVEYQAVD